MRWNQSTIADQRIRYRGRMHNRGSDRFVPIVAGVAALLGLVAQARAQAPQAEVSAASAVVAETHLHIIYTSDVEAEGTALFDVLALRLARYPVVITSSLSESATPVQSDTGRVDPASGSRRYWIVYLSMYSAQELLIALDYRGHEGGDDEVRRITRSPDVEDTAWTLGLVVEETLAPYLNGDEDLAALGAGLAIIEPEAVGGSKVKKSDNTRNYPRMRDLSLFLNLTGMWGIDDILAGPSFAIAGELSKRSLASLALGWSGTGNYRKNSVEGTMNLVPIELHFGYLFLMSPHFEIVGWTGIFMGFGIYRNRSGDESRTDVTFQPALDLFLHLVGRITRSWSIVFGGGARFPFVRDLLRNNGEEIYHSDWFVPVIHLGLQLRF